MILSIFIQIAFFHLTSETLLGANGQGLLLILKTITTLVHIAGGQAATTAWPS